MPLYEYQCRKCGRELEVIQKFSDDPLTDCTECGGTLEKVLSAPAVHFKGSGWYVTDYARKNSDKKESSPESDAKETVESESSGEKSEKSEKKTKESPKKDSDSTK